MRRGGEVCLEECFSNNTVPYFRMALTGDKGALIPVLGKSGGNDALIFWNGVEYKEETIDIPSKGKSTGGQMRTFLRDIQNDNSVLGHLDDVRRSTEMVLGGLLSSTRKEIVKFPLTKEDMDSIHRLIKRG